MEELLYSEAITYEDCGVLGGRTVLEQGAVYEIREDAEPIDLLGTLIREVQNKYQTGKHIYPYCRIALAIVHMDGTFILAYVDEDDIGKDTFSYYKSPQAGMGISSTDYTEIESWFFANDVQVYDILQQIDDKIFKVVGYKTPKDKEKYGHSYDVFRCLDIRGVCNLKQADSCDDFHNYKKYDMGEDFYIEAYDDEVTGTREYWLGRYFMEEKYLILASDVDDDALGLFDDNGNLLIDDHIAERICRLTDPHEYIFIDNDYNLSMTGLRMDGDE
ncbi:MAG: hypothetical protein J6I83_00280 [Firmicutes bacterium]|nr:hypothetical protein [Bacillota bacterium]